MQKVDFSIILPIYNQANQLRFIIESYKKKLDSLKESSELILVVNGSKDNSYEQAMKIGGSFSKVYIYKLEKNGWGRAVRFGISKSKGRYICFTNSARTNIEDLISILKFAKVNDNVVVKATRIVRDNFLRKLGSIIYNLEFRAIFRAPIWDVNGTPKVIPRKIISQIQLESDGDLIDAELIAKCNNKKIMIVEIPVKFTRRISNKSTTSIISALKMYFGIFKIKNLL